MAAKVVVLAVRFTDVSARARHNRLLRCVDCTCLFYEDRDMPDYAEAELLQQGRVPFYLQQGAGVGLLAGILGQVPAPPGARYVEVGCGFGFGLDFASRARGWAATGIDPGGMAALGSARLGVSVEQRYLGAEEPALAGACDVVLAAETIEHVPSPLAFLRVLRGLVRRGGVLVLTTPDAARLEPQTAAGAMVALLSPGQHLVFQTATSLRHLLMQAGFPDARVRQDGHGLVAHASDQPLRLVADEPGLREGYRDYLERRASDFPPGDDLQLGFAGRLLQECVNDGDMARAAGAYAALRMACQTRFGIDLDMLECLPAAVKDRNVKQLAGQVPLALGGILHADALRRLAGGMPRGKALEARFLCAADAADTLRAALRGLDTDDAMSEEIGWSARAEALLCVAGDGAEDIVDRLLALPLPPCGGEARWRRILQRGCVALVNAGHYGPARLVAEAAGLQAWADLGQMDDAGARDAMFCLAVLDVRSDRSECWPRAAHRFAQLHQALPEGEAAPLFWPTVQGEAMALERLGDHTGLVALLAKLTDRAIVLSDDLAARAAALGVSPSSGPHNP